MLPRIIGAYSTQKKDAELQKRNSKIISNSSFSDFLGYYCSIYLYYPYIIHSSIVIPYFSIATSKSCTLWPIVALWPWRTRPRCRNLGWGWQTELGDDVNWCWMMLITMGIINCITVEYSKLIIGDDGTWGWCWMMLVTIIPMSVTIIPTFCLEIQLNQTLGWFCRQTLGSDRRIWFLPEKRGLNQQELGGWTVEPTKLCGKKIDKKTCGMKTWIGMEPTEMLI